LGQFRLAIENRLPFGAAHGNIGFILEAQGKLKEAVECYCQAFERAPGGKAGRAGGKRRGKWTFQQLLGEEEVLEHTKILMSKR
jgi:hypothetical protein